MFRASCWPLRSGACIRGARVESVPYQSLHTCVVACDLGIRLLPSAVFSALCFIIIVLLPKIRFYAYYVHKVWQPVFIAEWLLLCSGVRHSLPLRCVAGETRQRQPKTTVGRRNSNRRFTLLFLPCLFDRVDYFRWMPRLTRSACHRICLTAFL